MIYNHVSLKNVIGRIYNTYDIKSADLIGRVPQWTGEALGKMNIYMGLVPAVMRVEVNSYKAVLPSHLKKLKAVEYNGYIIPRLVGIRTEYLTTSGLSGSLSQTKIESDIEYDSEGNIVSVRVEDRQIPVSPRSSYNYILYKNGYIDLPFETGELVIYYDKLPEETDEKTGMQFPLVPDNEHVLEAITWYILMRILYRGYKHPTLTFNSNNKYTNPGIAWDEYKQIAKNSASAPDREQRELHSKLWRSVVMDADRFAHSFSNIISES